jgi:hypothetical protein
MKTLWAFVIGAAALVAAGLGFYFGVYRKPARRQKVTNFFGSIGSGIKKYTTDLFKTNKKSEPVAAVVAATEDAIPA